MVNSTSMLLQKYNTYQNPAAKIARLVKNGVLFPIVKGLYETDPSTPGHYLAGVIYGPSYLSFEYALFWHGLIPENVYVYTSATCGKKKKKQYSNRFGIYTYRDVPISAFPYGNKLYEEERYGYVIASAEKSICDMLYTCSPCGNKKELRQLLFDDLRIDKDVFNSLNMIELVELAGLYHTSNHKLLISLIKGIKRHE
ncbi:MAG: hypothetical protein IKQ71_10235 [Lachnospiraceae bacterium]|nr:hypothetical protein [Lachnospiraceae bacterium]